MYQTRKFKVFIIFKRVSLNICKRKNIFKIYFTMTYLSGQSCPIMLL